MDLLSPDSGSTGPPRGVMSGQSHLLSCNASFKTFIEKGHVMSRCVNSHTLTQVSVNKYRCFLPSLAEFSQSLFMTT